MGILHSLSAPRQSILVWAVLPVTFAALALPCPAASASAVEQRNARPLPPSQQDLLHPDELSLTREEAEAKKREAARAARVEQMRLQARAEVEAAAGSVSTADSRALANALRVELTTTLDSDVDDPASSAFKPLGDLDGDGVHELVFRWSRAERLKAPGSEVFGALPGWVLFLFSWDGTRWRVSELMTGDGLCGLDTLAGIWPEPAIVAVEGLSSIPYPVIFRFQDHAARVAWDSRDETSRYQGYARGVVHFEERDDGPPAMVVSGRAQPGVIRFPPHGDRGFEVATVYIWDGAGYIPRKTEYAENEDYVLYRFISALHLRDFRTAYSLIAPAQFVKGNDKTLEAFRKQVEDSWPEFLGNSIFQAVETPGEPPSKFAFQLNRDNAHSIYFPTFSADGKLLLTDLVRRAQK